MFRHSSISLSFACGQALQKVVCFSVSSSERCRRPSEAWWQRRRGQPCSRSHLECRRLDSSRAGVNLWCRRTCCGFARSRAPNWICTSSGARGVESSLASCPGSGRPHRVSQDVTAFQGTSAPFARRGRAGQGWAGRRIRADGVGGALAGLEELEPALHFIPGSHTRATCWTCSRMPRSTRAAPTFSVGASRSQHSLDQSRIRSGCCGSLGGAAEH